MARILYIKPDHSIVRVIHAGGQFEFAAASPLSGEFRPIYDALIAAGVVVEPYVEPAPAAPVVSALEFRRLFTATERLAVASSPDPRVRVFNDDAASAPSIPLDSPDVAAGLGLLQLLGILTADRVAAIKAGSPPA